MMCIFTHACYVCMSTHKRTKLSDLCSRSENRYLYFSKETWREESLLNRENFAFSAAAEIQKGGYDKVLNAESGFGLDSFASAVWYQHSTYRHTWVSTHKEHSQTQETQIRKHSNANRHTHTNPCSPEQTHSQVSVHTQQCTVCPSIGLSITNYDSRVLALPLPPPHPPRIPHSRRLSAN